MKIAVAGKGGIGKTFISGTLSRILAKKGYEVLVVDADPNINTSSSIGIPSDVAVSIVPLSDNEALIQEKTGVTPGRSYGQMFRLTPKVSDIVDSFGVVGPDGVKLLIMGTVKGGNTGCMCPSNALLRILIQHMLIQRDEILIMDMVAGLEHLGRGTARRMDAMLIVVEPRMKSVDTARRIKKLAAEIEISEVLAVPNKVNTPEEKQFIVAQMALLEIPIATTIPYDENISKADMYGTAALDYNTTTQAVEAVKDLASYLEKRYGL